jgi:outer membrane protein TolC
MHQAGTAIVVANATKLPQLTLSGTYGWESLIFFGLFTPAARMWNLAVGIAQPVFKGGTLRLKRCAAIDAYDRTRALYWLITHQGLQDKADSLMAIANDAQALKSRYEAVTASIASFAIVQRKYKVNEVNHVDLLTARQTNQQARVAYIRATASRYADTVTLLQLIGLAWWNCSDPAQSLGASACGRLSQAKY